MLNASTAAQEMVVATRRNLKPRVNIKVIDPDLVFGAVTSSGENTYSDSDHLTNEVVDAVKYATNERCRMVLDGTWAGMPDTVGEIVGEIGFVGDELSGADGTFSGSPYVELAISGVSALQALGVAFTGVPSDGYGTDFTIEIYSGATVAYTETVTGNTKQIYTTDGFAVYTPTKIKVIFSAWSLPGRYVRVTEIIPGSYELWTDIIRSMEIQQASDFSCLSLPFGTAKLTIHNENYRFDPRNKSGLFLSLESRQAFELYIDVIIDDETTESIPVGVFYLLENGWKTSDDGLLMTFNLVDIIGVLASRKFVPPVSLPTTCEGWIAEIVSQLGTNLADSYSVDTSIASTSVTCSDSDVANVTCGDLLRWICQYVEAYPRACAQTGYLLVEPVSDIYQTDITLDNMDEEPTQSANGDLAMVTFRLNDGSSTLYTVDGTNAAASKTLNISNPFVKNTTNALRVAQNIFKFYGGQVTEIKGRGNPLTEIGDIVTVELGLDATMGARLQKQQFKIDSSGIMAGVKSTILQATGGLAFKEHILITADGSWTPPVGVTSAQIVLISKGQDGGDGTAGSDTANGEPGAAGNGALIYIATVSVTPGSPLAAHVGDSDDENTTLGGHSSASGTVLNGWTDPFTGLVYGKNGAPGVASSIPMNGTPGATNTGNGGGGGSGGTKTVYEVVATDIYVYSFNVGTQQSWYQKYTSYSVNVVSAASSGGMGALGGTGAIIIIYDKV